MVNKAILIGNVGKDPKISSTSEGKTKALLGLATTKRWKAQSGEKKEKTQWHNLVFWGPLADVVRQYVKKGDKLYVEGEIEYVSWVDQNEVEQKMTLINVREMEMLGSRNNTDQPGVNQTSPNPSDPDLSTFSDDIDF